MFGVGSLDIRGMIRNSRCGCAATGLLNRGRFEETGQPRAEGICLSGHHPLNIDLLLDTAEAASTLFDAIPFCIVVNETKTALATWRYYKLSTTIPRTDLSNPCSKFSQLKCCDFQKPRLTNDETLRIKSTPGTVRL